MTGAVRRSIVAAGLVCAASLPATAEPVTVLQASGNPANRLDIVIVGDGYTSAELAKYASDVQALVALIVAQQPWTEYASLLNIYRVDVASPQSGASHPESGIVKTTAFSASYNCQNIQRLICVDIAAVNAAVGRSVGASQHDLVILLVNDSTYGGSGGAVAVTSTNPLSVEIVLHEVGHSLGLLADEYAQEPPPCPGLAEPFQVNATVQIARSAIKWGRWVSPSTELPTFIQAAGVPGAYEGANYCSSGVYRPTLNSKMRTLGFPYEQINTEQLVKRFYNYARPIDQIEPASSSVVVPAGGSTEFRVVTPRLATHSPDVTWLFDGGAVAVGNTLTVPASALPAGTHTLTALVVDHTTFVRFDPSGMLQASQSWTISGGTGAAAVPGPPSSLTASSSGSSVTLSWTAPAVGGAPTAYIIEAGSVPGAVDLANFSTGTPATTFFASGVGAGRYYVRVRSANAAGQSAPTADALLVVGGVCAGAPPPPSLDFQVSGTTVSLAWTPSAGATSYVLEAGSVAGASNLVNSDTGNAATTFVASGVGAGTYFVRIRARNACGTSAPSNESIVLVR